ncbi:hypothetical protein MRB53_032389 [Persea americana]|uniref:Uncharacterized protein n=1 Tax=Persea americana TaxID=3435 RepID=A0ACC2KRN4_PERAE|nr:hypothetical protein MRB53_032389 [Persea americana]|eukprot:TRINITY_DN29822_c0_g1_i1.p1 TRINITY_DN29822_c0_g1~~TRINITY_DN29822_c0_g1_i1.p1  ORF type:complete len:404 (-),score=80.92 TRINITY_DN29822_c0_g1_i1:237-1448(-)
MKLKINKACDLSSISVLPPHSRRTNAISSGTEASVFGKSQGLQLRSQSQHSLSQGMSLSQLSQNSLDEIAMNEQRFGTQERDNSLKRVSSLPPISYPREESQMPVSRSSNNVTRRWNSSSGPDYRCQVSEELEHRIGLMETSLSRLGMVLDSVQSDVMQVNKSVKEVSLEMEGIRQKLIIQDSSLQLMLKGEEDVKTRLDRSLNSISEQLRKELEKYKLEETISCLSAVPDHIDSRLLKLQNELCQFFSNEVAKVSSMTSPNDNHQLPVIQPPKRKSYSVNQSPSVQLLIENSFVHRKVQKSTLIPETKAENSKLQKLKPSSLIDAKHIMKPKREEIPLIEKEQDCRVIIESDEEIDGLSFLLESKEIGTGNYLIEDAKEETRRILRNARRRRRKPWDEIILV